MLKPVTLTSERGLSVLLFAARLIFAVLASFYFHAESSNEFNLHTFVFVTALVVYLLLQLTLLLRPLPGGLVLSLGLDLITACALLWFDPTEPPPVIAVMFALPMLASVLLPPLRAILILGITVILVGTILVLRGEPGGSLTPATLFLSFTMLACAASHSLLLLRNHVISQHNEAALWQDPDTGLLSRPALSHTGGWLLPLHERLSSPLTAVLLRPQTSADLALLAQSVSGRLRRSDIGARADADSLVILLPDTPRAQAEIVLAALRDIAPAFTAVMADVPRETSLDLVIDHLLVTLSRSPSGQDIPLLHAPALRV
ncbi:hypothetical protein [Isoalcanivorax beigongshangi]|uniref:GGDEF domain-containing protein n=1 Tax=Isoalcanivorax beigongshangi TaxID=3238810 RepID=A0ABV4AIY6_9GAMM